MDDVSFFIEKGEIVGVVGESGSGKSVTCHSILGLLPQPPARIEGGSIKLGKQELLKLPRHALRSLRGKKISMVFQDPMSCLNPFMTILDQVAEPLIIHENLSQQEAERQALEMMDEIEDETSAKVILAADPCYGACDLVHDKMKMMGRT